MEPNKAPYQRSKKPVKDIGKVMGKKTFFFPNSLANERTPNDHKRCIMLSVNAKQSYIVTGEKVEIDLQEYSLLRDIGIINGDHTYEVNPEYDPIK